MPVTPAVNSLGKLHLAAEQNNAAKRAETALAQILATHEQTLSARLVAIEDASRQFELADRATFVRTNTEAAEKAEFAVLHDHLDKFAKEHLTPLQHLKEPSPDKRVMLVTRATKAPQALTAGALACEGMLRAELEAFASQQLAEIAEQPDGPTNEQCAYIAAAMNRAGRLERNDRPFNSNELAAAVHAPQFDADLKHLNDARLTLTNVEARWTDLRRNGKISALTRVKSALAAGAFDPKDGLASLRSKAR